MRNRYVSIDLETTGLDPDKCQVLEIGAVIEDWESPISELPSFQCFVRHEEYRGESYALSMNQRIFDILANTIVNPPSVYSLVKAAHVERHIYDISDVSLRFAQWLNRNGFCNELIVVAGKNFASFDLQFLRRLLDFNEVISRFHHRYIDPSMLYWNPVVDATPPSMRKCLEKAGIEDVLKHDAIDDACIVIKLIRHYFQLQGKWNMR